MAAFGRRRRVLLLATVYGLVTGMVLLVSYKVTSHYTTRKATSEAPEPQQYPSARTVVARTPPAVTQETKYSVQQSMDKLRPHLNLTSFRIDRRKMYRIHDNAILSTGHPHQRTMVCLSSIASFTHLHWLPEVSQHWTGPASISVFVHGHEFEFVIVYLAFLRTCFEKIRENFSFHLMFPVQSGTVKNLRLPRVLRRDSKVPLQCTAYPDLQRYYLSLLKEHNDKRLPFPQNHLRNVARYGCSSSQFFYMIDVDIVPQFGLYERLQEFLPRRPPCNKCLYVVPAFEGSLKVDHPRTKQELLQRFGNDKDFRVYHVIAFAKNQGATNFTRWRSLPVEDELKPAYEANFQFGYECFYVAEHSVPRYRERFIGYGFTRNVQTLEAHLAGFKFVVLNNAFMIHRGLRNQSANEAFREREKAINYKKFLAFRGTLQSLYGKGRDITL